MFLGLDQDDSDHIASLLQGTDVDRVIGLSPQDDALNTLEDEDPRIVITALPMGGFSPGHPFNVERGSRRFSIITVKDDTAHCIDRQLNMKERPVHGTGQGAHP